MAQRHRSVMGRLLEPGEGRLLGPFYAYMFMAVAAMAVFPFMVIYFLDLGFSFSQYFVLFGAWTSGTVFFEIPTGAVADSYSRKWSVIAGLVVAGVTAMGIGLTESYPLLLVLFIVNGIGFTFFSGAEDAWAIDNLAHYDREDLIDRFYSKNQAIMYAGMFVGPLAAGALVGSWGIRPLWFIWGGGYLLSALALTALPEHYTPDRSSSTTPMRQTLNQTSETFRLLREDRNLGFAFLATAFTALLFLDTGFWQPLLIDLDLPVAGIGYLTAAAAVVGVVMSLLTPVMNRYDFRLVLAAGVIAKVIILLLLPLLYGPLWMIASVMFIAVEATSTFEGPLLNPYIQERLPSHLRATAISVKSMVTKLIMGAGGIAFGALADSTTLRTVFPVVAVFGLGAIWALLRIGGPADGEDQAEDGEPEAPRAQSSEACVFELDDSSRG